MTIFFLNNSFQGTSYITSHTCFFLNVYLTILNWQETDKNIHAHIWTFCFGVASLLYFIELYLSTDKEMN